MKDVSVKAFEDRTGAFLFLPIRHGVYVRAARCVVEVPCPVCNVGVGELCIGPRGPHTDTHYKRRQEAAELRRGGKLPRGRAGDVLDPSDDPVVRAEQAEQAAHEAVARAEGLERELAELRQVLAQTQADLAAAGRTRDSAQQTASNAVKARRAFGEQAALAQLEQARLRDELDGCLKMTLRIGDWESIHAVTPLQLAIKNWDRKLERLLSDQIRLLHAAKTAFFATCSGIPTVDEVEAAVEAMGINVALRYEQQVRFDSDVKAALRAADEALQLADSFARSEGLKALSTAFWDLAIPILEQIHLRSTRTEA